MARFDFDDTFGEDYLHFYLPNLTAERNQTEATQVIGLLGLDTSSAVLDVPCGHGRITNLLAERGYEMTGLDASSLFLDTARADAASYGMAVTYVEGDMRSLPWTGPQFDGVVCWFTSFGYFDDEDNRSVLTEFRRVLRPAGKLVLETIHHDGFVRMLTPKASVVQQIGDDYLIDQVEFDPITSRIETDRTIIRDGSVRRSHHSVRLPTAPELTGWLHSAGFATVSISDRLGAPLTVESRRLVVVAE
ncbi:MAG: class I SAM-dependent methyltransferase [Candidatus Dormibacteria bacterium]